jgi:hypothetical protein
MSRLKTKPTAIINKTRNNPRGLKYIEFGKSKNIYDYNEEEISQMLFGVYTHKGMLLVDGDYFINVNSVTQAICELEDLTFIKKPNLEDLKTNNHSFIQNIRTFYVKNYYLITNEEFAGLKKHKISIYLLKIGFLKQGRNNFRGLFSVSNDYKTVQSFNGKKYPKDLFHPIKNYINGLFFVDDYKIVNFIIESKLKIENTSL